MQITHKHFQMRIITASEYQAYYELLNRNKENLLPYFPRTLQAVPDLQNAKIHLEKILVGYSKKEIYPFGIYDGTSLIGWISIKNIELEIMKAELGYFMDNAFSGQGIMTSAISEVTNYCFDALKMNKIFIRTGPENISSQKVALNNGFMKEGVLRQEFLTHSGVLEDMVYFGKLVGD